MIPVTEGDTLEFFYQITSGEGYGVIDQTPTLRVQRVSDGYWLKDDDTWNASLQTINLVEQSSTDLPGYYNYEWNIDEKNRYRAHYFNTNVDGYGGEFVEVYNSFPIKTTTEVNTSNQFQFMDFAPSSNHKHVFNVILKDINGTLVNPTTSIKYDLYENLGTAPISSGFFIKRKTGMFMKEIDSKYFERARSYLVVATTTYNDSTRNAMMEYTPLPKLYPPQQKNLR